MGSVSGRRLALSLPRRLVGDLLHASRGIPLISFERRMDLSPLLLARRRVAGPPAWALLFAKGYALVATRRPELRRAYLPLPRPHLWEADASVASVAVERDFGGEPGVFFGMLREPDKLPLAALAAELDHWKTAPVEEVRQFRRQLRYARRSLPARRFLWWYANSWSGRLKAKNLGTFAVSLTGSAGATAANIISPLATSLNCGVIGPDGAVSVRLHFDHRVLDGMPAARALAELEEVLRTEVAAELEAVAGGGAKSHGVGAACKAASGF